MWIRILSWPPFPVRRTEIPLREILAWIENSSGHKLLWIAFIVRSVASPLRLVHVMSAREKAPFDIFYYLEAHVPDATAAEKSSVAPMKKSM